MTRFTDCYQNNAHLLMEAALGERLKREYGLSFDEHVAMASLVYDEKGREALASLWNEYIGVAKKYNLPFIATTPTRRANRQRVSDSSFAQCIIQDNVSFLKSIRGATNVEMYIGGLMGCKGDAYQATEVLSVEHAKQFHSWAAELFEQAGADFLFAGIMPALTEAVGMAQAMAETSLPYIISFMVSSSGHLIDGNSIDHAIRVIDNSTRQRPLCYMANCVHPRVLHQALNYPVNQTLLVRERFCGIQSNSSPLSSAELDNAIELHCSDSNELAQDIMGLRSVINQIKIVGGCCGTDNKHLEKIANAIVRLT